MKGCQRISVVVPVVMALVAGCGHKETNGHAHSDDKTDVGVTFNAKHGLHVPPETAKFIGLQVAEVEERKVPSTLQFSAHIYRAASEAQFVSTQPRATPTALASASLSSAQSGLLRVEQPVTATSEGTDSFPGRILGINRDLEKASAHVEILLAISDERARLARGAFVSLSIPLGGEKDVVSVPRPALLRTAEGDFVYTVSGEHFVRTPIKVGMVNHEFVEVTDGLYASDEVVVTPVMTLWLAELQSIRGGKACADGH